MLYNIIVHIESIVYFHFYRMSKIHVNLPFPINKQVDSAFCCIAYD